MEFLKNTYDKLAKAHNLILSWDCLKNEKAYDNKYYPCNLILQMKYECEKDMFITDFSQYEKKKIIGITVFNKEEYPAKEFQELGLERQEVEEPLILNNVIVYSPQEGIWKWKYPN